MAEMKHRQAVSRLLLSSSDRGDALSEGGFRLGPCRLRVRTVRSTPKAGDTLMLDSPTAEGAVLCHTELPTDSDNTEVSDVGGEGRCCANASGRRLVPPRLPM